MLANVGLYSYLTSTLAYALLTLLLLATWRRKRLGVVLLAATGLSAVWATVIAIGTLSEYPPVKLISIAEWARNASWLVLLLELMALRFTGQDGFSIGRLRRRAYFAIAACGLTILLLDLLIERGPIDYRRYSYISLGIWLAMAIAGLLLIEQLFRNATEAERWSLKYLCLGLGGIFAYDFFMYAEGLLFRTLDPELWQARGFVNAIAAPFIAISISRNNSTEFKLQVSRQVVFHSITLLGAGLYLILMALAGYFIKYMNATWGGILQVAFLVATAALLIALLFSGKIRATARVLLDKHFFSYRYDYREEWIKFTQTLASMGDDVPNGIIQGMASLVSSKGGLLWAGTGDGQPKLVGNWLFPTQQEKKLTADFTDWLTETGWVIDLDEYRSNADIYPDLTLPDWLREDSESWLVIPLMFREDMVGVLLLKRSDLKASLNWEDRDLLKTTGRQAASHLAQFLASEQLVEARQFEAFNRLSAYVIHDLKNILAQQSLMIANAEKHKGNPAFVDDMISTVTNSVERMTKLMEQMRSGLRGARSLPLALADLLAEAISARSGQQPLPSLEICHEAVVQASRERLLTVFGHLLQNAQEATDNNGTVAVRLDRSGQYACIDIEDSGTGMEADFIRNRLFKPFDSTKGLTGMGIGAFESREFIRSLGGDITVTSAPGEGSHFRVTLPLAANDPE